MLLAYAATDGAAVAAPPALSLAVNLNGHLLQNGSADDWDGTGLDTDQDSQDTWTHSGAPQYSEASYDDNSLAAPPLADPAGSARAPPPQLAEAAVTGGIPYDAAKELEVNDQATAPLPPPPAAAPPPHQQNGQCILCILKSVLHILHILHIILHIFAY
jgi:hypothetical protein